MFHRTWILVCAFVFMSACGGSDNTVTPSVPVSDSTPPVISLHGDANLTLEGGADYYEQGASASDNVDGRIDVTVSGAVDIMKVGVYTLTYTAVDKAGNRAKVTRTVSVVDTTPPTITLNGAAEITLEGGSDYYEKGAFAIDKVDGQIDVVISGAVYLRKVGSHILTYKAVDKAGNRAMASRIVSIVDTTPPTIILNGAKQIELVKGLDYFDKGATAFDIVDGDLPLTHSGKVDISTVGDYTLTYTATDLSGNSASVERIVIVKESEHFITRWQVSSDSLTSTLLANPNYSYDYTIDWGDGYIDTNVTGDAVHTYASEGEYEVKISGQFPHFQFKKEHYYYPDPIHDPGCSNCDVIRAVIQWGNIQWRDMSGFFHEQNQFTAIETDQSPDLSQVQSLSGMFYYTKFNGDISRWDVSSVTNMNGMFQRSQFIGDISQWDVSNVRDMEYMFRFSQFNGDISQWDVSNASYMNDMFAHSLFNGDISEWDVSNVTDMSAMFEFSQFDGDISQWDVSNVTDMSRLFESSQFNGDIAQWDVSNVTNMTGMFAHSQFNGDISLWDVSSVKFMGGEEGKSSMFEGSLFSGDLSQWDVSSVTNMKDMFAYSQFNGDISQWDVSNVTDMSYMFADSNFNGDISEWDVSNVAEMLLMFYSSPFNGDISQWDVSSVKMMLGMFNGSQFNGDISQWDVSNVTDMTGMFYNSPFNGELSQWDVSSVKHMGRMLSNTPFNGDISQWDVSSVFSMGHMFAGTPFNGDISQWDVSSVKGMAGMFKGSQFNSDISQWDVGSVTTMGGMFEDSPFNGDISQWDVSSVTNMNGMFESSQFNSDISLWEVSKVMDMGSMFADSPFNGDISQWDVSGVMWMWRMLENEAFSQAHYDALLNSWSQLDLQDSVSLGVNQFYSERGATGRAILIEVFNWNIDDKGLQPSSQNTSPLMF